MFLIVNIYVLNSSTIKKNNAFIVTDQIRNSFISGIDIKNKNIITHNKINYKVGEFKNDLFNNIIINKRHIQNILIKSDIIVLHIGYDEFISTLDSYMINQYLYTMVENMNSLLKELRCYSKEKIIVIGYNNPYNNPKHNKYVNYINNSYNLICEKLNIDFIDISKFEQENFTYENGYYLNQIGYQKLNNMIESIINY